MGALLVGLGLVTMACARAQIDSVEAQPGRHVKPDLIVVHDFAVSPHEVALDSAVGHGSLERLGVPLLRFRSVLEVSLDKDRELSSVGRIELVQQILRVDGPAGFEPLDVVPQ